MKKILTLYSLISLILTALATGAEPTISASISPSEVTVGYPATLTIQISGSRNSPQPTLPQINNISSTHMGSSQNIQIINGSTSMTLTHQFRLVASKPGTYLVPSFNVKVDNKDYPTDPITLRVGDPTTSGNNQNLPKLWLEVKPLDTNTFVGQPIPIELKLYAQTGLAESIRSFPKLLSDDFNNHGFNDNGTQGQTVIDGIDYTTLKWNSYISPYKSGNYEVAYNIGINVFNQNARPRATPTLRNFFSGNMGSMLDDMMGNTVIPVELQSEPTTIAVQAIPQYGKPDSFTGGVGNFEISQPSINTTNIEVGEPITLSFSLSGMGNFEQITAPELPEVEGWKSYAPKSSFNKNNNSDFEGTKTFEYVLIPRSEDIFQTPEIEFSYFDPSDEHFEEVTLASVDITVMPASIAPVENFTTSPTPQASATTPAQEEKLLEPLPIHLEISSPVKTTKPLIAQTRFQLLQLLPLILIIGVFLYKKIQQKHLADRVYMQRKKSAQDLDQHINDAQTAFKQKDAQAFYSHAQQTIADIALKSPYAHNSQSMTISGIEEILRHHAPPQDLLDQIHEIYTTADHLKFSQDANHAIEPNALTNLQNLIQRLQNLL